MKIKPCKYCQTDKHVRVTKTFTRHLRSFRETRWEIRCCNCGRFWSATVSYKDTVQLWNTANQLSFKRLTLCAANVNPQSPSPSSTPVPVVNPELKNSLAPGFARHASTANMQPSDIHISNQPPNLVALSGRNIMKLTLVG